MKEGFSKAAELPENGTPERQTAIEKARRILQNAGVKDPEPAKTLGAVTLTPQGIMNAKSFFEGSGGLPGSGSNRGRYSDQD